MKKNKDKQKLTLIMLIIVAVFAVNFVSAMGFLNYRATAIELEDSVISRIEQDAVSDIETSLSFGKSFTNFYGMQEIFDEFKGVYPGPRPFVISRDGELMYYSDENRGDDEIRKALQSKEFTSGFDDLPKEGGIIRIGRTHLSLAAINMEYEKVGYFCSIYNEKIFQNGFKNISKIITIEAAVVMLLLCLALYIFSNFISDRTKKRNKTIEKLMEKTIPILIISGAILMLSFTSLYSYQQDYREKMDKSVRLSLNSLEKRIDEVRRQGVELRDVTGLEKYIRDHIESLETLRSVRITEHISIVTNNDEQSDLITFVFGDRGSGDSLFLEAELSDTAVQRAMWEIILVLFSTTIILLIFVYELSNLVDLFSAGLTKSGSKEAAAEGFSEKRVSTALRFTGLLCSTAEYMCVPYAAMMIRASGESLFGLSVGMTAALPLTLEGFAQMIGMLVLPRYVRKFDIKKVLTASAVLMIACNISAFAIGGAFVIILCRALAGIAYSGFKQVSNYLITSGYETETGRSENISQDNAGLLAGATCGAGLGAIISANSGFAVTFLISAVVFAAYLAGTKLLVPWDMINKKAAADASKEGEREPINVKAIFKMFSSPEILKYVLLIGIPLNIGVMLCVTLIPAICQTNGISSVMLSYCYIANGIAGIYIGPALVSRAKAKFGTVPCLAFTFAITAVSIFILKLPMVAVMIVISSSILGFLDGFGTPLTTDRFMELDIVRKSVDESTALIFSVVLSYVLLTFAPMVAELMLLPGKGVVSPMLIGAIIYAAAAVLLMFSKRSKSE